MFRVCLLLFLGLDHHGLNAQQASNYGYTDQEYEEDTRSVFRLSDSTEPTAYDLKLVPNLNDFTFRGEVTVDVLAKASTSEIIMHSKNLEIQTVKVMDGTTDLYSSFSFTPEIDLVRILTRSALEDRKTYKVQMEYTGKIADNMKGFYRSSYKIGDTTKKLAATNFQPTYARTAFPCYDEPRFRTPFTISITRSTDQLSISNMNIRTSTPVTTAQNQVTDAFETTSPIPTHSVSFVVSELKPTTDDQRKLIVWTRSNAEDQSAYVLQKGTSIMKELATITKIEYTLPKVDLVAVPDFKPNSKHSHGLNMFREQNLLYDQRSCPDRYLETVNRLVIHELSLQWLEIQIKPQWWDNYWLGESIATYFEYELLRTIESTWRMDEIFVVDVKQSVLSDDNRNYLNSLNAKADSPKEIYNTLDRDVHRKGGALIRMIQHMVTFRTFQAGLQLYLADGSKADGPQNFWDALDRQVRTDNIKLPESSTITSIVARWIANKALPLVYAYRQGTDLHIDQIQPKTTLNSLTTKPEWTIPITFTKQSKRQFSETFPSQYLAPQKPIVLKEEVPANEWFIINLQGTGLYRVNYDADNWDKLINQLHENHADIHPVNRAELIDDSCNLAIDDTISYSVPLKLMKYLDKEEDMIPWLAAIKNLKKLYKTYEAFGVALMIKNYILERFVSIYKKIGLKSNPEDSHLTKMGRAEIVNAACKFGLEDCVKEAVAVYIENEKNLNQINPNLRSAVFCSALRHSEHESKAWQNLWDLYKKSNVAAEKVDILLILGCTYNQELLKSYLGKLIDDKDEDIRQHDIENVLPSVLSEPSGVAAGLELIKSQISKLDSLHKNSYNILLKIITMSKIQTDGHLKIFEEIKTEVEKLDRQKHGALQTSIKERYDISKSMMDKLNSDQKRISSVLETAGSSSSVNKTPLIFIYCVAIMSLMFNKRSLLFV